MGARILAVEDTPANLDLMTYLLRAYGHRVVQATTGGQGVALAAAERPDLVVLDIQLPDMDGYEVLRRLREDPGLVGVPVIAVTAYAMVGDRHHALAAGFDGYVAKPIDPVGFTGAVESYLPAALCGALPGPGAAVAPSIARPRRTAPRSGVRVLAIDDNAVNLALLRSTLEPHGYLVATAASVLEAVQALDGDPPDLVISDVHLADGTGGDLLSFMRADAGLAAVPFALITATSAPVAAALLAVQQGVPVIRRPIDPDRLLAELDLLLGALRPV